MLADRSEITLFSPIDLMKTLNILVQIFDCKDIIKHGEVNDYLYRISDTMSEEYCVCVCIQSLCLQRYQKSLGTNRAKS